MDYAISKILYKFFWLLWVLGFHYIYLYYFLFKNIKYVFLRRISSDGYFLVLILFFFLQLLSTLLSIQTSYFSETRFLAILHNEIVFLFLIVGYVIYHEEQIRYIIIKNTLFLLLCTSVIVIITGVISLYFSNGISFNNVISSIYSGYPTTTFTKVGWYEGEVQIRSMAFTIFPNATAIFLVLLYAIASENLFKKPFLQRLSIALLVFSSVAFTGSRIVTIFALLNIFFVFFNKPSVTKSLLLLLLVGLIPFLPYFFNQLSEIYLARSASNEARFLIQSYSIRFMLDESPLLGLGLKPRINELFGGKYPVGSHSTYIGYLVKNGLIGGGMIIIFFMSLFIKSIVAIVRENYSYPSFILNIIFLEILIILFFEDIDAYEMNALLFGFLISLTKSYKVADNISSHYT